MDTRPTHEFTTSGGHTLVFNDYVTGAENREIRAIYIRASKKPEAERDDAQVSNDADDKLLSLCIVSLDGDGENIPARVAALPLADFKEIIAEANEVYEGKKK
jgi:hypothetical protein